MPQDAPPAAGRAASAYGRSRTPKQLEAEVFARANRAIALAVDGSALDHRRAVADNRRLWDAVHACCLDPTNALPPPLRASIAGVALAVIRACEDEPADLRFVEEMNTTFAAALWS